MARQQLVDRQTRQIDTLTAQQEKAYEKVQDIANRAVESARRNVVASPSSARPPSENVDG
jgi:hypothetical protein